jgi:predicted aldo/keto reductase-like oxidoreductase
MIITPSVEARGAKCNYCGTTQATPHNHPISKVLQLYNKRNVAQDGALSLFV